MINILLLYETLKKQKQLFIFCPEPVLPALPVRANHLEEYYFSVDPVKIVLNNLFPSFGPPLPTNCTSATPRLRTFSTHALAYDYTCSLA